MPFKTGMEISSTATSGSSCIAASTAACPSPTAATTSQQSAERRSRTYSRICLWSSATNTRIFDKHTSSLARFVQKTFGLRESRQAWGETPSCPARTSGAHQYIAENEGGCQRGVDAVSAVTSEFQVKVFGSPALTKSCREPSGT